VSFFYFKNPFQSFEIFDDNWLTKIAFEKALHTIVCDNISEEDLLPKEHLVNQSINKRIKEIEHLILNNNLEDQGYQEFLNFKSKFGKVEFLDWSE